jgi:MFS family permease
VIALATTLGLQIVAAMMLLSVPVIAPLIAADIGFDTSRVGLYSSLYFGTAMWLALLGAPLISRFGSIRILQIGLLVGAGGLALSVAGAWWAILASAAIMGLGYGPSAAASSHLLSRKTPAHMRAFVFSIKQSGVPIGGIIAGLVLPVVALQWGWQAAILVCVGLALAAILAVQPLRAALDDDWSHDANRAPLFSATNMQTISPLRAMSLHGDLPALIFSAFASAALQGSIFALMVSYLVDGVGLNLVSAGLAFSTMQTSGALARVSLGWIADRYLRPQIVLGLLGVTGLMSVALTLSMTADWPLVLINAVCVVTGVAAAGWNGVFLGEIARIVEPAKVGQVTSGAAFFTFLGYLSGPAVCSVIIAITGSYAAAFTAAGSLTLVAGTTLLIRSARK